MTSLLAIRVAGLSEENIQLIRPLSSTVAANAQLLILFACSDELRKIQSVCIKIVFNFYPLPNRNFSSANSIHWKKFTESFFHSPIRTAPKEKAFRVHLQN